MSEPGERLDDGWDRAADLSVIVLLLVVLGAVAVITLLAFAY